MWSLPRILSDLSLLAIMLLTLFMARATLVLFIQADSNFNLGNTTVFCFRSEKADHFHILSRSSI